MMMLSLTGKRWQVTRDFRAQLNGGVGEGAAAVLSILGRERNILVASDEQSHAYHPSLPACPQIDSALKRVKAAVEKKEHVAIFGDYDCDGITSVAQLARFFQRRGISTSLFLPHRTKDGYGLKEQAIERIKASKASLLITADTGISSVKEVAFANAAGIDVIILDHHQLPKILPEAYAIIHPALAERTGPPPAAAGLTLAFIAALESQDGNITWDDQATDLALAMIGTVADLVELKGENRRLVQKGLKAFASLENGPLALLAAQAGILDAPTSRDIAFRIAPRLNAAGRMSDPMIALRALLGEKDLLTSLEDLNRQRQSETLRLFTQACSDLEQPQAAFLCTAHSSYHPGIIGLIAGKLVERCGRPTMVASIEGDLCTASLRSIPDFDVTAALASCSDLLISFGGHAQAAGCTFSLSRLSEIRERLTRHAASLLTNENRHPLLSIDGVLDRRHITLELCEKAALLEPFGQGNPEPRFLLENIRLESLRRVGKDGSHLQAKLGPTKLVGFNLGSLLPHLSSPVDIAFQLSIDRWQGLACAQLVINDVRISAQTGASFPSMEKTSVSSTPSATAIL